MFSRRRISATFVLVSLLSLWVLVGGLLSGCAAPAPTSTPTIRRSETPAATPSASIPPSVSSTASYYTEYRTEHFTIHYTPEVSPTRIITVGQHLETAWREVPVFLEHEPPAFPINVYIGPQFDSSYVTSTEAIMLRKDATASTIAHEFTHILTGYSAPRWMEDGLAVYVQGQCSAELYWGCDQISADSWSIGLLRANRWVNPLDFRDSYWRDNPDPTVVYDELCAYWESGSFVKYLIETYGLSAFWEMHDDVDGWSAAEKVYGKSIDTLIEEWRQHLADSTIPPEDCPACILTTFEWADLEIQFYQHRNRLDTGTRELVVQEFEALKRSLDRKDAHAMQRHLEAARQLLGAEIDE